jgi:hypothetical protein
METIPQSSQTNLKPNQTFGIFNARRLRLSRSTEYHAHTTYQHQTDSLQRSLVNGRKSATLRTVISVLRLSMHWSSFKDHIIGMDCTHPDLNVRIRMID